MPQQLPPIMVGGSGAKLQTPRIVRLQLTDDKGIQLPDILLQDQDTLTIRFFHPIFYSRTGKMNDVKYHSFFCPKCDHGQLVTDPKVPGYCLDCGQAMGPVGFTAQIQSKQQHQAWINTIGAQRPIEMPTAPDFQVQSQGLTPADIAAVIREGMVSMQGSDQIASMLKRKYAGRVL